MCKNYEESIYWYIGRCKYSTYVVYALLHNLYYSYYYSYYSYFMIKFNSRLPPFKYRGESYVSYDSQRVI